MDGKRAREDAGSRIVIPRKVNGEVGEGLGVLCAVMVEEGVGEQARDSAWRRKKKNTPLCVGCSQAW